MHAVFSLSATLAFALLSFGSPLRRAAFTEQNGVDAKNLAAQFASLTPGSPCNSGENACIQGAFAQCLDVSIFYVYRKNAQIHFAYNATVTGKVCHVSMRCWPHLPSFAPCKLSRNKVMLKCWKFAQYHAERNFQHHM
jgi:hypothetical protein